MSGPLMLLLLAAVPSLGVPGLSAVDLPADRAAFFEEHLIQELGGQGLKVMSGRDIASLLGLERQKALMGCDQSSCAMELANALGVQAVLLGSLARLDGLLIADIRVLDARSGTRLAAQSARAKSDSEFLTQLDQLARLLAKQLSPEAAVNTTVSGAPARSPGLVIAALGVAAGVTSVVFAVQADAPRQRLDPRTPGTLSLMDAASARERGKSLQSLAVAFGIGSGVAILAGALLAWSPWAGSSVTVVPTKTGAQLTFGGAW